MIDSEHTQQLRASAIELLRSGNSPHAVAAVLDVPLEVLNEWMGQGETLQASSDVLTQPKQQHSRESQRPHLLFDSTIVHGRPIWMRVIVILLGLVPSWIAVVDFHEEPAGSFISHAPWLLVAIGGLVCSVLWGRTRLVFGRDKITAHDMFQSKELAYSDVASYTYEPDSVGAGGPSRIQGHRLEVLSKQIGVRPISVFVYEGFPLSERIFGRLNAVRRISSEDAFPPTTP